MPTIQALKNDPNYVILTDPSAIKFAETSMQTGNPFTQGLTVPDSIKNLYNTNQLAIVEHITAPIEIKKGLNIFTVDVPCSIVLDPLGLVREVYSEQQHPTKKGLHNNMLHFFEFDVPVYLNKDNMLFDPSYPFIFTMTQDAIFKEEVQEWNKICDTRRYIAKGLEVDGTTKQMNLIKVYIDVVISAFDGSMTVKLSD